MKSLRLHNQESHCLKVRGLFEVSLSSFGQCYTFLYLLLSVVRPFQHGSEHSDKPRRDLAASRWLGALGLVGSSGPGGLQRTHLVSSKDFMSNRSRLLQKHACHDERAPDDCNAAAAGPVSSQGSRHGLRRCHFSPTSLTGSRRRRNAFQAWNIVLSSFLHILRV